MPSTLSVKSLLVVGFHTHTHTQTHYMQLMSVYWSLHQKINNEATYIDDIPECCMHIYIYMCRAEPWL